MVTPPPIKYEGPERRGPGSSGNKALSEDRVRLLIQQSVADALQQQQDRILAAMDERFEDLSSTFKSAFPGGDPHGHRIAHEKAIESAGWWDRIKGDAISKTVTGSVWVFLACVAVAVWEHVKNEARKG